MKFNRHSRRRAKLYKVTIEQVAPGVIEENFIDRHEGRARYRMIIEGRTFWVTVASDDPNVIVTLFPRRKE